LGINSPSNREEVADFAVLDKLFDEENLTPKEIVDQIVEEGLVFFDFDFKLDADDVRAAIKRLFEAGLIEET
jgi:peptidyl-tRNA hydrolase